MQPAFTSDSIYDAGHALALLSADKCASSSIPVSYHLSGRLHLSRAGWLMLSVPSALIRGARDAVSKPGYEPPHQPGIPIMLPEEVDQVGPDKVVERGHQYQYRLGGLTTQSPATGPYAEVLRIAVYSPDLRKLRLSYGLPPYPKGASGFFLPVACRRHGVLTGITAKESADDEVDWSLVKEACGY